MVTNNFLFFLSQNNDGTTGITAPAAMPPPDQPQTPRPDSEVLVVSSTHMSSFVSYLTSYRAGHESKIQI